MVSKPSAMECVVADYNNYCKADLEAIKNLIVQGGEVGLNTLATNLTATRIIAVVKDENKIIATASIKRPRLSYASGVFSKSKSGLQPGTFDYELGYIFVEPAYRGKQFAHKMCSELLKVLSKEKVFATTRTDNHPMQRTLEKIGFKVTGTPYEGRNEKTLIQLWLFDHIV